MNSPTSIPQDPYIGKRTKEAELKTFQTPSSFDKLKQFMEMDRKVLRLFCQWDDRDNMFGEMRPFVLHVSKCCCALRPFVLHVSKCCCVLFLQGTHPIGKKINALCRWYLKVWKLKIFEYKY